MSVFGSKIFSLQTADRIQLQVLRYGIVGGIAFVVDFTVLVVLTDGTGLHYLLSAAVAFGFGVMTNYILSIAWVFNNRSLADKRVEFIIFAVIGVFGLGLTEAILYIGTGLISLDYRISKIIAVGAVFFWNFGVRKAVLFSERT